MRTRAFCPATVLGLVVGLAAMGGGCQSTHATRRAAAKPYEPSNVFRSAPQLPPTLQKVAVLPLAWSGADTALVAGGRAVEPILLAELRKRQAFAVVAVTREQLLEWTGRTDWGLDHALPADFFSRLHQATGCDGVFLAQLTVYRAYPPLAVGWTMRLVDGREPLTWWSLDETFDAGAPSVARAAELYGDRELGLPCAALDRSAILQSPRRFAQYTANACLATLPSR